MTTRRVGVLYYIIYIFVLYQIIFIASHRAVKPTIEDQDLLQKIAKGWYTIEWKHVQEGISRDGLERDVWK